MVLIVAAYIVFLIAAGIVSIAFHRSKGQAIVPTIIGFGALGLFIRVLVNFKSAAIESTAQLFHWSMPSGSMFIGLDSLSAFFLVPLLLLSAASAFYGPRYMAGHNGGRFHWFYFSLLAAGMTGVLLARNAVLFLMAWEVMSLSSFLLVISDRKKAEATRAGWIYFVTAHLGTAFLLALFFVLSSTAAGSSSGGSLSPGLLSINSFDFASWNVSAIGPHKASLIFILALVGFGLKAGFIPFHVWLPIAHPAAPSHVSALMSGIMIKMGIYGILRILTVVSPFEQIWWGVLLIALGAISGVLGVLFAISQHDIKRLLAYHSVENIGIILLGMGVSIVGSACGMPQLALFGMAGALLHVVNHALFKSLLFLGAGAIIRQTGIGDLNRLGGLIRTMPLTAIFFLAGSIAICGLPFFNGFISELLIYSGAIRGVLHPSTTVVTIACVTVALALTLIGGLAAACFTKVFGTVFLGQPREPRPVSGEVPFPMLASMAMLAVACLFIGLCSFLIMPGVLLAALPLAGATSANFGGTLTSLAVKVTLTLGGIIAAALCLAALMQFLRRTAPARTTGTWDCGYVKPAPSMQYTASSFAAPIIGYFGRPVAATRKLDTDKEFFPRTNWAFHSSVNDWYLSGIYVPVVRFFNRLFSCLHWFQNGKAGLYVAYIALMLCALIVWKFFL